MACTPMPGYDLVGASPEKEKTRNALQSNDSDPMDLPSTFSNLGISLGLGLLVGLQREQVATQLAGLRTFALTTVLGTICGLLSTNFGGWVIASGLLVLTGGLITGHVAALKGEKSESAISTAR